jgi:hypothetical protein
MSTRAYIRYPERSRPLRPGRQRRPTEFLGDAAPFNDLQFFRCIDGRIFAVAFPAPRRSAGL